MLSVKQNKFIIKDWAGNILSHDGYFRRPSLAVAMEFDDFEDGWAYIFKNLNEEYHEDIFVEPKDERS